MVECTHMYTFSLLHNAVPVFVSKVWVRSQKGLRATLSPLWQRRRQLDTFRMALSKATLRVSCRWAFCICEPSCACDGLCSNLLGAGADVTHAKHTRARRSVEWPMSRSDGHLPRPPLPPSTTWYYTDALCPMTFGVIEENLVDPCFSVRIKDRDRPRQCQVLM